MADFQEGADFPIDIQQKSSSNGLVHLPSPRAESLGMEHFASLRASSSGQGPCPKPLAVIMAVGEATNTEIGLGGLRLQH